ncbi:AAA family ATPase [Dethiobacter alkaliphilus]|uniref:Response regulator receiver protein n=1 Tax=Dethiobacter alkaliphilus AHT 1 TaxID=555088 RepID=C0GEA2_DETAL|nr:AAA family ATPase [Dethiobacter alkaliphilus]EEG78396.1 response regulator receiver protein [Dethiobacter alkaliphilus AHT 1]
MTLDKIKTLIVNDDMEIQSDIVDIFANVEYITVVGEAETAEEALEFLENENPDVLVVGANIPGGGHKLTENVMQEYPDQVVILVERELKEETVRKAIFAGAKDVLVYPFTPAKLVDAVYRSFQLEQKKQDIQRSKPQRKRRKTGKGQVVTVFSTKGGVGRTFVSANLAVALAEQTKGKVVLVDLDLDFGNAALALNIVPRYTISDIIDEIRNLDQDMIESYLIPHRSGIKLLPANAQPQMAEFISSDHIEIILKVLQNAFDYVVVDMPGRFYEPVDPAFQAADMLLMVTTPEVATVRNVKAALIALDELNYPKSKIKVVLNRSDRRDEIKPKDVETTMNHNLFSILPADYKTVPSSLNQGIPVVLLHNMSKISRSFHDLTQKVVGDDSGKSA